MAAAPTSRTVGRYAVFSEIAAGGMATVHLGRLRGASGFTRLVAIKRLHPQFAKDGSFAASFLDEARLAARVTHPNVVPTLDVVATDGELFLVMDYVQGESLGRLIRAANARDERIPIPIVGAIVAGVLRGLHAAHEAKSEGGEPLGLVHRDVSPQNVIVGCDGVARVLDFGIAKAAGRAQNTTTPTLKGKIAYMPPEQARSGAITRRTDVFAAGIVLWEMLTLERLYEADDEVALLTKVLTMEIPPPSRRVAGLSPELDAVAMRALSREPADRFATAEEMATALEACTQLASPSVVAAWLSKLAGEGLARRAAVVAHVERSTLDDAPAILEATARDAPSPSRSLRLPLVSLALVIVSAALASVLVTRRHIVETAPVSRAATVASAPSSASTIALVFSAKVPLLPASTPSVQVTKPPKLGLKTAPVPSGKAKCDPPYTVDALGRHRYLPECL